jgi:cytochrome P450
MAGPAASGQRREAPSDRRLTVDVAQIDLLDRDRFTEGIPHEWFTWLRANAPVFHHDEPGGDGFWVITRYDDIVTANRDEAS